MSALHVHSLLTELWLGNTPVVWSMPDGSLQRKLDSKPKAVLSGSFDPLHSGHVRLRIAAEEHLQGPVYYELSLTNVDKPTLDLLAAERRRRQFYDQPVALTCASRFVQKADLLANTVFVVGVDTAERLLSPGSHPDGDGDRQVALASIRRRGCRFLVAGRRLRGHFCTLSQIAVPNAFQGLFAELPEHVFREDVSSTELRKSEHTDTDSSSQ